MTRKAKIAITGTLIAALAIGAGSYVITRHRHQVWLAQQSASANKHRKPDPIWPAVDAYNSGHYKDAEAAAQQVADRYSHSKDSRLRRHAVDARYVLAFSSARQKKMQQARDRFTVLKAEAASLPDKGKQPPMPGEVQPTLEQEGAFQHAVCTGALGDKKAAEAEYMKFMRDYPDSPLIGAAARRIGMMHNNNVPDYAEKAFEEADRISIAHQRERAREEQKKWSMCGPLCIAEFLHRNGRNVDSKVLANEMKTNENGTSMLAMTNALKNHGLPARGEIGKHEPGVTGRLIVIQACENLLSPSRHPVLFGSVDRVACKYTG